MLLISSSVLTNKGFPQHQEHLSFTHGEDTHKNATIAFLITNTNRSVHNRSLIHLSLSKDLPTTLAISLHLTKVSITQCSDHAQSLTFIVISYHDLVSCNSRNTRRRITIIGTATNITYWKYLYKLKGIQITKTLLQKKIRFQSLVCSYPYII